jgi:putative oxidoreductase
MSSTINRFLATDDGWVGTILRLTLGVVMFPHGAQKLLGWFGGYGFGGTMGFLTGTMHIPTPLAFLVIMAESLGSVALIFGAFTRLAALGIGANMVGAVLLVHAKVGFFMNWFGQQKGEGFEYHLLAIGIVLGLLVVGGGRLSVDRALTARSRA